MKKSLYIFIISIATGSAAFAASFKSSSKDSVAPTGTYDSFSYAGVNCGIILDEYGMTAGIPDGVVIDYEGDDYSLNEISGIRFYKRSSTLTGIGDVHANIRMNFTHTKSGDGELSGLFFRKASQADGKSIFVDKIDLFAQDGGAVASAVGINNWESTVGNIVGRSEGSFIRAVTNGGNDSIGIWNQTGAKMGSISNLKISASGGNSNAYAIRNDSGTIGDINDVVLEAKDSKNVYGISANDTIGNLNNVKINVSGTGKVYGIKIEGGRIGSISNSIIIATGGAEVAGLLTSGGGTVVFENSSSISAVSSSGSAYSVKNQYGSTLTLKGDSTIHTFNGGISANYTDWQGELLLGKLIFDGHFKLQNCRVEAGNGIKITAGSSLTWTDKLVVEGDVTIDDSSILNIYLSSLGLDEYLALESDASITLSGEIDLNVYDQGGQLLEDWKYELRPGEGGDQLWITAAVPEPATYAAILGVAVLVFAIRRKSRP